MSRVSRTGPGWISVLSLLALWMVGCSRGRDNAQVASEVQNNIRGDRRLQLARVQVRVTNGIVTLSGYIGSADQRVATEQDATQIEGVKVVVDNLRMVDPRTTAPTSTSPAAAAQKPAASVVRPASRPRLPAVPTTHVFPASAIHGSGGLAPVQTNSAGPSTSTTTSPASVVSAGAGPLDRPSTDSEPVAANASATPAPPPAMATSPAAPEWVTVPSGTALTVRLTETVSSDLSQKGDTFLASLASPITIGDKVVIPAEAGIQGKVVEVQNAGPYSGKSALVVEVTRLAYNGRTYDLHSDEYSKQGPSRSGRAVATIGGGAGVGALIGGILGGGRGAAIGAMIGAGAGTGIQGRAKAAQVQLPAESMLSFRLEAPITVVPSSTLQGTQSAGSDSQDPFSSDDRPVLKRRPGGPPPEPDADPPGVNPPSGQNPPEESTPPPN